MSIHTFYTIVLTQLTWICFTKGHLFNWCTSWWILQPKTIITL